MNFPLYLSEVLQSQVLFLRAMVMDIQNGGSMQLSKHRRITAQRMHMEPILNLSLQFPPLLVWQQVQVFHQLPAVSSSLRVSLPKISLRLSNSSHLSLTTLMHRKMFNQHSSSKWAQ